jgi:adenylate cyclase
MFTDIVGYSAMMAKDEKNANKIRDRHQKVLEESIVSFGGKILQYYGDGTLIIFGSAIQAVSCAVKIQLELQTDPPIPLRIGLHLGDIIYDQKGVYGDSVNVASRIESLAVPGSILISGKVYDEIRNHPGLPTKSLGSYDLKNIKKPMKVYALTNQGLTVPDPKDVVGKTTDPGLSIAVLPFVNMSSDPENEYFSDGVTEELTNALVQVEGLHVISSTSAFFLKGKTHDLKEIGSKLNVTHITEGSVRKSGDTVRITAQLINVKSGYHLWSETFDRKVEDILKVQDEISKSIVDKLRDKLAISRVTGSLIQSRDTNIDAYNHYLMGLFYWKKWTSENMDKAIKCFEDSIEIDPKFALAYAYMAICYIFFGFMGLQKPKIAYAKAKQHAEKALELDDKISESHLAVAMSKLLYEWKLDEALISFEKALELSPGSSLVRYSYSMYLLVTGEIDASLREIQVAMQLDPLSWLVNDQLGNVYNFAERFDDAIKQFEITLEMSPLFRNTLENLGLAYAFKGEHDKAIEILTQIQVQTGDKTAAASALGYAYAKIGKKEEAYEYLNIIKVREQNEKDTFFSFDYALIYSGLKQYDKMFEYLEKSVDERLTSALFLANHPEWKALRNDERFKKLLLKIGLKV